MPNPSEVNGKKLLGAILAIGLLIILGMVSFKIFENVSADEILVVQAPFSGELTWHVSPGTKWQGGGDLKWYKKLSSVEFKKKLMFNDNGTAVISGKFQVEMPLDPDNLTQLHTLYGSMEAIQQNLIQATLDKVIIATGPTMSSKESSAESRNDLIRYITDQLEHGVYRMRTTTKRIEDPLNPKDSREVRVAEIMTGDDGQPLRQEISPLAQFGIKVVNFAPSDIDYDEAVERQIAKQQEITMKVQTSRAEALEAEQRKLTAEAEGKARVTTAQYEREVTKVAAETDAKRDYEVALTKAKQDKDVAEQKKVAAAFYKQEQILIGEGDAARKKAVMEADGALEQRLKAIVEINGRYAAAIQNHPGPWVPNVIMGGNAGGSSPTGSMKEIIDMFAVKAAKEVSESMPSRK